MKNLFNTVKMTKLKRNAFDLSHDVKLTLDMGNLVPIMLLECIPGDKHTISCESLLRFAPLIAPVMHRFDVTMHYFFVPNRIVWPNWEKYITNTKDENTGLLPAFPTLEFRSAASNTTNRCEISSLPDYMGVPVWNTMPDQNTLNVSAIPFAAYQCIYNEYYRDQNLIDEVDYKLLDGSNEGKRSELLTLRKRAWEHDYFTACLPWAQKGDAVNIPLGDVILNPNSSGVAPIVTDANGNPIQSDEVLEGLAHFGGQIGIDTGLQFQPRKIDPNGTLSTSPTSINDLRRAFKLQEWLEKAARGGSRYIEWLKTMFNVISSDKRLQRPEYITGIKSPVIISEVLNTTGEIPDINNPVPQGNMAGHAVSVTSGQYGSYYVEEHGYIIGIMSVMPKPAYMQSINRTFIKTLDPTQFYFSSFANIGEQEVYNKEIYAYANDGDDTFGYIPRYAEYRYEANRVAGNFNTDLFYWHQSRLFGNQPNLNQNFIECNPDKRIFAVSDINVNSLYCQVYNKVNSIRPIPKYGTPTF